MGGEQGEGVRVSFGDGSDGRAVGLDGTVLTAVGPTPYPPGRPLELSLALAETTAAVRGKTIGSKRRDDDLYDVRIRLVNLRREHREALASALAG